MKWKSLSDYAAKDSTTGNRPTKLRTPGKPSKKAPKVAKQINFGPDSSVGGYCSRGNRGYSKAEMMAILSRHADLTPALSQKIRQEQESILHNSASPIAKRANGMVREVFREVDRQRQFTRTTLNEHGVLYGKVQFRHEISDLVLTYFHSRFPKFVICLYNTESRQCIIVNEDNQAFTCNRALDEAVAYLSASRPVQAGYEDFGCSTEEMFDQFYSSQHIKARENRRYFRHMIPRKMMEHPGLKGNIENRFQNRQITEFTPPFKPMPLKGDAAASTQKCSNNE